MFTPFAMLRAIDNFTIYNLTIMITNNTLKVLTVGLSVFALASCGSKDSEYDASGVFEATEVVVSAKAQGEILSLNIEEGDEVKQGDVLGEIDATLLTQKKSQMAASQSANDSRILDLNTQIASVQQQISNAEREKARFSELLKAKAATQKQVDDISYQISTLKAQLAALKEQVSAQNKSLREQSASMDSQMSQVATQIGDATIKSPITGVVLQKYAEAGEYAAPGKALFKVADIKDMKLRAYITTDQLNSIKIGQKVTVYADEGTEDRKAYEGRVTWISSKAEFTPKTIMTRDERANLVYAIKISVDNKQGFIKSGMYGEVAFDK